MGAGICARSCSLLKHEEGKCCFFFLVRDEKPARGECEPWLIRHDEAYCANVAPQSRPTPSSEKCKCHNRFPYTPAAHCCTRALCPVCILSLFDAPVEVTGGRSSHLRTHQCRRAEWGGVWGRKVKRGIKLCNLKLPQRV